MKRVISRCPREPPAIARTAVDDIAALSARDRAADRMVLAPGRRGPVIEAAFAGGGPRGSPAGPTLAPRKEKSRLM